MPRNRPQWLQDARRIWEEDDGLSPGRERADQAWSRLFDEPLDPSRAVETFDGLDEIFCLLPGGRIFRHGPDGTAIYQTGG
jgi:hypothetical protein